MKVIDKGLVTASRPKTDAASCCFPTVCALDGGRWLVGMRMGPAKMSRMQRACGCWSDDEGKSWSPPAEVAGPLELNGTPGTWRTIGFTPLGGRRVAAVICREDASHPFLPMFNEATEGLVDMKLFTALSEDGGEHFSTPQQVRCGKYDGVPTPATGPMLLLPGGRWAVQFEVNKHYNDPAPWQHASALTFSLDQGKTWGDVVDIHTDPQRRIFCWDQRIATSGNTVAAAFWTYDQQESRYLSIHSRTSTDGARTWGPLHDTGIPGQPARLVMLDERRWIMVYVDRTSAPTIRARLSHDGGKSWPAADDILIHQRSLPAQTWNKGSMQDAWAEMNVFSIGLPDAVGLPNGDALAVFYSGDHHDYTDIHWTRLRI